MRAELESMKNIAVCDTVVTIRSAANAAAEAQMDALAAEIVAKNKALWKKIRKILCRLPGRRIFLLNHVEEFDILKSRSLWMEEYHVCKNKSRYQTLAGELDKKYFCVMLGFCGDGLFSADQLEADEHSGWSVDNG